MMDISDYSKIWQDRKKYIDAILESDKWFKVVVAGPGTGKTILFSKLLAGKPNSLTLTFIYSLVEDLSLELYGITEVRTLHGFARSILSKLTGTSIKIFPKLSTVIKEDALILREEEIDFDFLLYNRELKNNNLEFYTNRKNYYEYYGYTDIIYAAVEYFEKYKNNIPSYEQVLIDEFQDFNKLEVSLIDILSEKSPVLLAGDDDQALYDFKSASTQYIREKYSDDKSGYESFTLPYCSRSTNVIVDAINDIIESATKNGYLKKRIPKKFMYFNDEEKDKESSIFSRIQYIHKYDSQLPWFITSQIGKMAEELRKDFNVLIISPYRTKSVAIVDKLKSYGFKNIDSSIKSNPELTIFDGIRLIIDDRDSKLGWRIALKWILDENEFISFLKDTEQNLDNRITELITREQKNKIVKIVKVLKSIIKNKEFKQEDFEDLLDIIGLDPVDPAIDVLKNEIDYIDNSRQNPAISKINIKATTIQSSKGLSADLVFITHFDNRYFIKDKDKSNITDQDICNLIVALSRAKKKVYLISTVQETPVFLEWINRKKLDFIR